MDEFFNYCRQNPALIIGILTLIAEIVFIFVKKRPKTVDDFVFALNEICKDMADIVSYVESPGNGEVKKSKAIEIACGLLSKRLNRDLTDKEKVVAVKSFDSCIESVLSAPTKKEKCNEK